MKFTRYISLILLMTSSFISTIIGAGLEVNNLEAHGRYLRIDLTWDALDDSIEFEVQRSTAQKGPFKTVRRSLSSIPVFSDFIGTTGEKRYYRVRALKKSGNLKTPWSETVSAISREATDEEFLTEIQEANFRYFWNFAHPVSGLAREGTSHPRDVVTMGASGMGCFNIAVGIERGFITRKEGVDHALKTLRFLTHTAERFHGAFPHWMDGRTGKVVPFNPKDDGADLVETGFLIEGVLFWREYFDQDNPAESEIRKLAHQLWLDVEWDFFLKEREDGLYMMWHWSPTIGWRTLPIWGFTECHVAYVLAIASPTHPIPMRSYHDAWDKGRDAQQAREVFGIPLNVYRDMGPPLFFLHYSYMGLDPKEFQMTKELTYFDEFVNICKIQIQYAQSRKDDFVGYGPLWGLTASIDPDGYLAHRPGKRDNGTITPTAAMASLPYVPDEAMAFMKRLYKDHGKDLWREFAFVDAFNPTRDWVTPHFLGIDTGPIAPMIENHRTGLFWDIFMQAPEIQNAVQMIQESDRERFK